MRGLVYIAAAGMVALSAVWAYRVNYAAQDALDRVAALRSEIAGEREALVVLRADWAWLNAPERLSRLVAAHAGALGLRALDATHFVAIADVPMRPPELLWVRADPEMFAPAPPGALVAQLAPERPK